MLEGAEKLWVGGNPKGSFDSKWHRVAKIQKIYPEIDSKLRKFCEVDSLTERKACAFAVLMMIETGIRIGNEDSAEGYVSKAKKTEGQVLKTYGLTTLLREHVSFPTQNEMVLDFIGKKSVAHKISITDPFLVKIGFQFYSQNFERWIVPSNGVFIEKNDVNRFIKKSIGAGFTAKDFRAFRANIEAARQMNVVGKIKLENPKKKEVSEEIKLIVHEVSEVLGNTPGIAKKAYINPEILHRHWESRGFKVELQRKKGKVKEIIIPPPKEKK